MKENNDMLSCNSRVNKYIVTKKKYTTDRGSRCSGWGVYPGGRKCRGCSDCKG